PPLSVESGGVLISCLGDAPERDQQPLLIQDLLVDGLAAVALPFVAVNEQRDVATLGAADGSSAAKIAVTRLYGRDAIAFPPFAYQHLPAFAVVSRAGNKPVVVRGHGSLVSASSPFGSRISVNSSRIAGSSRASSRFSRWRSALTVRGPLQQEQ